MLVATDLTRAFGTVHALDGFDLTVEPGEICGLIGPNGAGKTTFVEVVCGLTRPDRGSVRVGGLAPKLARGLIGFAPQEIALYLSATVRQNLRLFGGLAGLRGRALRTAIDRTAERLELTDVLDRVVALLSGGQKRRTQAATAMLHAPRLLLLDEPTVGADPVTRQALLNLVREAAQEGAAVCYTTHYLPELVDLDATLAVCRAGRVIARGPQRTLLASLPGELRLSYPDGRVDLYSTPDPPATLAGLLAGGARPSAVDIHGANLDDLFRSLAVTNA